MVAHPVFARACARLVPAIDRAGAVEHRFRLVRELSGRVLEVGAGTGAGLRHLPPAVTGVVAVEPEPYLRVLARRAAAEAPVPAAVVAGVAERLPLQDGAVDGAVCSLVLCSVVSPGEALAELRRVLRPGGRLVFWEHVRAEGGAARVQDLLDRTVWPALAGGCHTGRDTLAAVATAGFAVERVERFRWPETRLPLPTAVHVLGSATRL